MNRLVLLGLVIGLAIGLAACGPMISIRNDTDIGVRVAVFPPGERNSLISIPANDDMEVDVQNDNGQYKIVVIPNEVWLKWATNMREMIVGILANPVNLTPEQILDLTGDLLSIQDRINSFGKASDDKTACSGAIKEGLGVVDISLDANGKLTASCQ